MPVNEFALPLPQAMGGSAVNPTAVVANKFSIPILKEAKTFDLQQWEPGRFHNEL